MKRAFLTLAAIVTLAAPAVLLPRASSAAPPPVVSDMLFAVVRADCTIARSLPAGATCLEHALGNYTIKFDRNVRGCAYFATIGLAGHEGTELPSFISVVAAVADPRAVYVKVDDITGNNADRGFHLMVDCKRR